MATTVLANTVLFEYSLNGELGTYYTLVCEADSSYEGTVEFTREVTKCGILKAPGEMDNRITLNGVVNIEPGAGEASYNEVQALAVAKTKVWARYVSTDDDIHHSGTGWFGTIGNQNTAGEVSKFSFTFEFDGDISTNGAS
jgi:hypothetical protein